MKCRQAPRLLMVLVVLLISSLLCSCGRVPPPIELTASDNAAAAAQGGRLVQGLAACGACHGAQPMPNSPLAGGRSIRDPFGEIVAPNITPSRTALRGWSASDIIRALRASKRPNGESFSSTMHRGYEWLSDDAAIAIATYLRALSPVDNRVERRAVGFIDRNTTGLFIETSLEVEGFVPAVPKNDKIEYGGYLVDHVARCGFCHTTPDTLLTAERYLGGNSVEIGGQKREAPNISNSDVEGIGAWSEGQIINYLKTGETPDNRREEQPLCPVAFYAQAEDGDLEAIAAYLKQASTEPPENAVKDDGIRKIGAKQKERPKRSDQLKNR